MTSTAHRLWMHDQRRRNEAWREARTFWRWYVGAVVTLLLVGTIGGYIGLIAARLGL